MKDMKPKEFSEAQVDRLLAGKFRDTTPEFEARWVQLRRELRQAPPPRRTAWMAWTAWLGAVTAGAALVLAVVVAVRRPVPTPETVPLSPELAELLTMDAVLHRAQVLLDDEQRAALLHLPVENNPKT